MLTSLTTFMGLLPLLHEKSMQARFLVPMAVSLAFGVVFSTVISLLIVSSTYLILEDVTRFLAKLRGERAPIEGEASLRDGKLTSAMATFTGAVEADADSLLSLMADFNAGEAYPFDPVRAREALLPLLKDDSKGRVWIIRDQHVAVGYVVLTLGWSLEYQGQDAFVDELFVASSHRRRGLGTRALEVVEEACRNLGVRALHLEVERENDRARELYRTRGFADKDRLLMTRRFD